MPEKRIEEQTPRERCQIEREIDSSILALMSTEESWPWSTEEIARELGSQTEALDAIRRLSDHGLMHRMGDFVFPTRAARRSAELDIAT